MAYGGGYGQPPRQNYGGPPPYGAGRGGPPPSGYRGPPTGPPPSTATSMPPSFPGQAGPPTSVGGPPRGPLGPPPTSAGPPPFVSGPMSYSRPGPPGSTAPTSQAGAPFATSNRPGMPPISSAPPSSAGSSLIHSTPTMALPTPFSSATTPAIPPQTISSSVPPSYLPSGPPPGPAGMPGAPPPSFAGPRPSMPPPPPIYGANSQMGGAVPGGLNYPPPPGPGAGYGPPPSGGPGQFANGYSQGQSQAPPPAYGQAPGYPPYGPGQPYGQAGPGYPSQGFVGQGAAPSPITGAPIPPSKPHPSVQQLHGQRRPSDPKQKIDPNQIPRPQATREIIRYVTRGRTMTAPPPATSDFLVVDEGNCSPRFIRPTLNHVPSSRDMFNNCKIPMAVVLQPMAALAPGESPIPMVDFGDRGPIRCTRCNAYMNPFMKWVQSGRKFQCNICGMTNDAPNDYQCHPDEFGRRRDAYERPELSRGSVDYLVNKDYSVRPPQEPIYVFVIDVSSHSVNSGLFHTVLQGIRDNLDHLGGGQRSKVGIVTFDRSLHFYNLDPRLADPVAVVVADIDEPFAPLPPSCWLVSLEEGRSRIDSLLDQLPDLYKDTIAIDAALGAAVAGVMNAMQETGGKVTVFQSCLPRCGVGQLTDREASRNYGTDRERAMYSSDEKDEFWKKQGELAALRQISVDFFICGNYFSDVATTNQLCTASGGQTYYYPSWRMEPGSNNEEAGLKLRKELGHNLQRLQAYESVLKVRCSTGMDVEEYIGHCTKRMLQEIDIATIDEDQAFVVSFSFNDKLEEGGDFHVQCALLHTNVHGRRCVRVHNLALPVASLLTNVFRYADLEAICAVYQKKAIKTALAKDLSHVREELLNNCVEVLYQYRKHCASQSSSGQLILPESLKLFPLYTLGAMKSVAFRRNDAGSQTRNAVEVRSDERAFLFNLLLLMSVRQCVPFVYPNLYSLHDMPEECGTEDPSGRVILPPTKQPSSEQLREDGIFLLDDTISLYLFLGQRVDPDVLQALFGESRVDTAEKPVKLLPSEEGESDLRARINNIIRYLREGKTVFQELTICTRTDWRSGKFMGKLVEDRTKADISYVEFLCLVHKKIQAKFL